MNRLRVAFVGPTKNRPDLFRSSVAAIRPQVDVVVTVAHGSSAVEYAEPLVDALIEWVDEVNISAMWSAGLDLAAKLAKGKHHDVAVLNDDAIVDHDWFDRLAAAMHAAGAAGASGSRQANKLATMAGYAFLLDGTKGVRADERMRWWFSDDAVQQACVAAGGFVAVNGIGADNLRADTEIKANPTLREWSREDRETFRSAYGEFILPSNTHRGKGLVPLVISAPSGKVPTHLLEAAGNRPILVLSTPEWEDQHLRYAADTFDWFVFVKESTRILDAEAFWAKVDTATEPAWLFAWPSCYMGLFARSPLQTVLRRIKVTDKWGSVREEAALAKRLGMRAALWPEICDANALRVETVDGEPELVIGNAIIEKSKGSAWCGRCEYDPPGVCEDLLARFKVAA
jgi:hypothetical protein